MIYVIMGNPYNFFIPLYIMEMRMHCYCIKENKNPKIVQQKKRF